MARHTDIIVGEVVATHDETLTGSVAKAVNDLIGSATAIQGLSIVKIGKDCAVIVVWDDA
jgi:hypothetical protein